MKKSDATLPDTNVILRYLLKDVPEQFDAAADFFEQVRTGAKRAAILESVVVECVYVLMKFYGAPKEEVAASLSGLLQYKGVVNRDKTVLIDALRLMAETGLDMVDCVLIAKGGQGCVEIMTFDKEMDKIRKTVTMKTAARETLRGLRGKSSIDDVISSPGETWEADDAAS